MCECEPFYSCKIMFNIKLTLLLITKLKLIYYQLITGWWASLIALFFGFKVVFFSKTASIVEPFAAPSFWVKSPSSHIRLTRSRISRLRTNIHWRISNNSKITARYLISHNSIMISVFERGEHEESRPS